MSETKLSVIVEKKRAELQNHNTQVDNAIERAREMTILNDDDAKRVGSYLAEAKRRQKYLEGWKEEVVTPIYRTYKAALKEFSEPAEKYKTLTKILNGMLGAWDRKVREEQKRRERELREQQQLEADDRRKKLEAEAARAEKEGDVELAAELKAEAETPEIPSTIVVLPQKAPQHDELVRRSQWKARVTDVRAFVDGVLSGDITPECARIEPNMRLLNSLAGATRAPSKLPGVEFYEDVGFAGKA